jgi:transposase
MERIEVITSVQRRRRYSGQEKAQFVAMTMQPGSSVSSVARQYGISPSLLFKWKRLMQASSTLISCSICLIHC